MSTHVNTADRPRDNGKRQESVLEKKSMGLLMSIALLAKRPKIRLALLLALHSVLFLSIYAFAFYARLNFQPAERHHTVFFSTFGVVVLAKLAVFYFGGHFHGWWRYVTFADLRSLLKVSLLSMIVIAFIDYFAFPLHAIPRVSILLDMLGTVLVIGGFRSTGRFADEILGSSSKRNKRTSAILVGTDHRIGQLASQINSNQSMPCRVKALVAESSNYRRKALLGGVPVLGHLEDVMQVAKKVVATEVLVLTGTLDGPTLRQLTDRCNAADLKVRLLPRFEDAMRGTDKIPLRQLDIEDLLRRDPVVLNTDKVENLLTNKRVLVTGAGGSIGSEICRQVMKFGPTELILLGRGENRIHAIHGELRSLAEEAGIALHIEIGDITDIQRMERLFKSRQPNIVFHAAAHKHVPLMELHPGEAIKNNAMGTKNVAELADRFGVEQMVLISTDKAVRPTSVMGAAKALAERLMHAVAINSKTRFCAVRFGNVLGSAGSVVPIFQEQIRQGGPVTITDKRMTRFFMSIPEASQLVLQAAGMSKGGEIFVLDMGESIQILDLAKDVIRLSGLPANAIEIKEVGMRPGEKLFEELSTAEEETMETDHPKVFAFYQSPFPQENVFERLDALLENANTDSPQLIREHLFKVLAELGGEAHQSEPVQSGESVS
ncbi:MAG: nucleoside-diphosphate sugar epimerase/dehydratase [Rubripirellula sp.]